MDNECRKEGGAILADAAAAANDVSPKAEDESEQNASTKFSEHVGNTQNFARKFGHYKQHMNDGDRPEEGSSTDDNSQRAGSYAADDSNHLQDRNWQVNVCILPQS